MILLRYNMALSIMSIILVVELFGCQKTINSPAATQSGVTGWDSVINEVSTAIGTETAITENTQDGIVVAINFSAPPTYSYALIGEGLENEQGSWPETCYITVSAEVSGQIMPPTLYSQGNPADSVYFTKAPDGTRIATFNNVMLYRPGSSEVHSLSGVLTY